MLTKYDDPIENDCQDPRIDAINSKLAAYNIAYKKDEGTKIQLRAIIDTCEEFIRHIPRSERTVHVLVPEDWKKKVYSQYPGLEKIIMLQKQAVNDWHLPDVRSRPTVGNLSKVRKDTLSRWRLIQKLVLGDRPDTKNSLGTGRMLDEEYWPEFKFEGKEFISRWICDRTYDYKRNIYSYGELSQLDYNIKYYQDPSQYKVKFENGLAYQANGKLLDTSKVHSGPPHDLNKEVIYVVGLDGSVYVNDPDKICGSKWRHSSFIRGKRVLCAGTMRIIKGEINVISLNSGHYKPKDNDLLNFLSILKENQINLENISIKEQRRFIGGKCLRRLEINADAFFNANRKEVAPDQIQQEQKHREIPECHNTNSTTTTTILKSAALTNALNDYLKNRQGDAREYFSGCYGFFQFSKTEKIGAVKSLLSVLSGKNDTETLELLKRNVSALCQGKLGEEIRQIIKDGKGNDIVSQPINTIHDFIDALSNLRRSERFGSKPQTKINPGVWINRPR